MDQWDWADTRRPGDCAHLFRDTPAQLAHQLWPGGTHEPKRPHVSVLRRRLANYVQEHWVQPAGLTPRLEWSGDRARLALGIKDNVGDASPLLRVLALQHLEAVIGAEHAFTCSHCGALGCRPRKPRTDQNVLCDVCQRRAGSIQTQRWRQKLRSSREDSADDGQLSRIFDAEWAQRGNMWRESDSVVDEKLRTIRHSSTHAVTR